MTTGGGLIGETRADALYSRAVRATERRLLRRAVASMIGSPPYSMRACRGSGGRGGRAPARADQRAGRERCHAPAPSACRTSSRCALELLRLGQERSRSMRRDSTRCVLRRCLGRGRLSGAFVSEAVISATKSSPRAAGRDRRTGSRSRSRRPANRLVDRLVEPPSNDRPEHLPAPMAMKTEEAEPERVGPVADHHGGHDGQHEVIGRRELSRPR